MKKINAIALFIKTYAIIRLCIGLIGCIGWYIGFSDTYTIPYLYPIFLAIGIIIVTIFVYGFGEIIQLLEDIKSNSNK